MKHLSRFWIALLVMMLSGPPTSLAQDGPQPDRPAQIKSEPSHSVGFRVFRWSYQADDGSDRPLIVAVWYPAQRPDADQADSGTVTYANGVVGKARQDAAPDKAKGPYPLIVWSHGFTGSAISCAYLLEYLAERGYVVAAPDHNDPVSAMRITGNVDDEDLPAKCRQAVAELMSQQEDFDHDRYGYRPMELALAMENVLAQSEGSSGDDAPLAGMVSPASIGAGGHSMGGYTVLTRIGCMPAATDRRIKVAVLQSPATWMWQEADYETISVPTMYMLGEWEAANREQKLIDTETAFASTPAPTWQVHIARSGHSIFTDPRTLEAGLLGPVAEKIMANRLARADTIARYTAAVFDLVLKADDGDAVKAAEATLAEGNEWTSKFEAKSEDDKPGE